MKKYQIFLSENFHVLVVKFSVYLNRQVFVMDDDDDNDDDDDDDVVVVLTGELIHLKYFATDLQRESICKKSHHYENTPIQIYRKFHLQKLKNFR